MALLDAPAVAQALNASTLAYLGTDTGRGPTVAPVVFATSGDRVWVVMPVDSKRVAVLRKHPRVGLLMCPPGSGDGAVVACGEATVLDPTRPFDAFGVAPDALRAPTAMLGYLRRNAGHLLGVVVSGEVGVRVMVSVAVDRVALATPTATLHLDGAWTNRAGAVDDVIVEAPPRPDLDGVPIEISAMADQQVDVAVGWRGGDGPLVLPGRWNPERNVATVSAAVIDTGGGELSGPASITFDTINGTDLDEKRGMTIRGFGRGRRAGSAMEVALHAERVSYWSGAKSGSVEVASSDAIGP